MKGEVIKVSGPLVVARGLSGARMFEMVRVGELGLFGEIIEIKGEEYSIQTYEETEGIGPGQPVVRTGEPLSVELGPGLIRSIYDGIQRPLDVLAQDFGEYIVRGTQRPALDRSKKWDFVPLARVGDVVKGGDILGTVEERALVSHKIMVPPGKSGTVGKIGPVTGNVDTEVAVIQSPEGPFGVTMVQRWPVRDPRPTKRKVPPTQTMTTGQRIIDMFFPITKGGTPAFRDPSGAARPSCSTSSPSGPTRRSSSMSAAASAATR